MSGKFVFLHCSNSSPAVHTVILVKLVSTELESIRKEAVVTSVKELS
jgi:hypothetical protein